MINFGSGILFAVPTADSTGAAIANATPVQFGNLQDISVDISFEEKLLYGGKKFPIAFGQGKGKIGVKAKSATINGSIFGDLFLGTGSTAGIKGIVQNFPAAVPASTPYTLTIAPPNTGTFTNDLGVLNTATGLPLKRVASAPTAGQYSVSAGVYTFAAADSGNAVLISYEYTATSTTAKNGTITNQLMGYAPSVKMYLTNQYGGNGLNLVLNACTASKLSMPFKNDDFSINELDFSAFADASGSIGYWSTTE
ncbi:MAG: hypothetical protein P4L87_25185 [Formivibrio sp.]|nr:hypothetical protein [Formivibrio sp.]